MQRVSTVFTVCLLAMALSRGECVGQSKWYSPEKIGQGYTVVLPGTLGRGPWDLLLARGLNSSGLGSAIEVYDWTKGPVLFLFNGLAAKYNRRQADHIAQSIVRYRQQYPNRPVHLVGHSGGATLAVFVLEALPPECRVDTTTLLGCGLARDYDLRKAVQRSGKIHNYYSPLDVAISQVYLGVVGIATGQHWQAAGAYGFKHPQGIKGKGLPDYGGRLEQHQYALDMLSSGHLGGHFGWTAPPFARDQLAPVLAKAGVRTQTPNGKTPNPSLDINQAQLAKRIQLKNGGKKGQPVMFSVGELPNQSPPMLR